MLSEAGYDFEVVPPSDSAECGICSRETPPELVGRLAYQKAENVAKQYDSGLILGCDTVAECGGVILGKPRDKQHAYEMLNRMRGRKHNVYSGICLWRCSDDRVLVKVDKTLLQMDPITDDQLKAYLNTDAWQGKAGAFGYQDGINWIDVIQGSQSNVVGLPMELFSEMLAELSGAE